MEVHNCQTASTARQLDQFYTKDNVAAQCFSHLRQFLPKLYPSVNPDQLAFLEPSAGDGAFLRALGNRSFYAYDLAPAHSSIVAADFLTVDLTPHLPDRSRLITIGNPPFGKRAKLAIAFINQAFRYSDTIAFILPIQFQKYSAQSQIIPNARLIFDQKLPENSFRTCGKDFSVRCCFQIWTTRRSAENLRLHHAPITTHPDFDMWQYNNTPGAAKYFDKSIYHWDFAVPRQGYKDYNIKETDPNKMDRHTQWIFFKAHTPAALDILNSLDFTKLSHKNTSTPGFGKADVIQEYNRLSIHLHSANSTPASPALSPLAPLQICYS